MRGDVATLSVVLAVPVLVITVCVGVLTVRQDTGLPPCPTEDSTGCYPDPEVTP